MKRFRIIRWLSRVLMNRFHAFHNRPPHYGLVCTFFILFLFNHAADAQCPANLGFESGDFKNWECFAGKFVGGLPVTQPAAPLARRHTIFKRSSNPGKDPYGRFPIMCPNGSEYTIRLGNDSIGEQIDGVSYTLTVPSDKDVYSIIYNYAVVFQDPAHLTEQQPRFTARVFDVETNDYINCSSFDFSASSSLPGFKKVPEAIRGDNIFYKPWTPVTIKLVGYAGKQLRIDFTASDCTLGAHFGYAYLDVNEDCTTPITGNVMCGGATNTVLVAPYGFRQYNWYTEDFSKLLGTGSTLRLDPLPPPGTKLSLEILPYPGSGCIDTLHATMQTAAVPFRFQVQDSAGACPPATVNLTHAAITAGSSPGLSLSYFTDASVAEYLAEPAVVDTSGIFYIKAANSAGCIDIKPVVVAVDTPPRIEVIQPGPYYYPKKADLTSPALYDADISQLHFDFWKDVGLSIPVADPGAVDAAGNYYMKILSKYGCYVLRTIQIIIQIPSPPNAFTPNNDGVNDVWLIPGLDKIANGSVDVYDRQGRRVYHSTGYPTPWNGTYNGKPLPVATYYYLIKANDKLPPLSGSVTLLR
jgi:gliding motility-associated-like protein